MNASISRNLIHDTEVHLSSKISSFIDDRELRCVALVSIIGLVGAGLLTLVIGLGVTPAWD